MNDDQEIQSLRPSSPPVGGTFRLRAYGLTSEPLPHDTTPDQVNVVLEDMWQRSKAVKDENKK